MKRLSPVEWCIDEQHDLCQLAGTAKVLKRVEDARAEYAALKRICKAGTEARRLALRREGFPRVATWQAVARLNDLLRKQRAADQELDAALHELAKLKVK